MRASIQEKIAPARTNNTKRMNTASIDDQTGLKKDRSNDIDFKSLLMESNMEETRKREMRKNGDLSTADSYESFLEELALQTEQKNAPKNTMDKDDFLTLFVTQLQQQDPLNPQDGTEMAAQLAQFNSLEQMMNVNSTLNNLVSAQENSKKLQFLNYVGKEVTVSGGKMALKDGEINDVTMQADRELGRATMVIRDRSGSEVYQRELGVLGAGKHKLNWDGVGTDGEKRAEGIYTVEIKAQTANGDPVTVGLNSAVTIKGIDLVQTQNNLFTDIGTLSFDQVQAVGSKGFANTDDVKETKGIERAETVDQLEEMQGQVSEQGSQQDLADEEVIQKAKKLAEKMGYSIESEKSSAQGNGAGQKSGRIPISKGQYAENQAGAPASS